MWDKACTTRPRSNFCPSFPHFLPISLSPSRSAQSSTPTRSVSRPSRERGGSSRPTSACSGSTLDSLSLNQPGPRLASPNTRRGPPSRRTRRDGQGERGRGRRTREEGDRRAWSRHPDTRSHAHHHYRGRPPLRNPDTRQSPRRLLPQQVQEYTRHQEHSKPVSMCKLAT